ncbi:MAG: hypothetical protein K9J13_10365 [Saprospiraceae bacterium]|nr:hypothetical protein [Saprospiraceae bacterium]
MKTRKIISNTTLSIIIISLSLIFSNCKKKTYYPIPQEAIDYFACFGDGSEWTYMDKDSVLHKFTLNNFTKALYSNKDDKEWDAISYEIDATSYFSSNVKVRINWAEEDLDFGWRIDHWGGLFWIDGDKTYCYRDPNTYHNQKIDSMIICGVTYYDILPFTANYAKHFFAKNIGLIKYYKLHNSGNQTIVDSLSIVEYKIK